MRVQVWLVLGLLGALGLAANGCSAAHVDDPSITIEELCSRITEALCTGRQACCSTLYEEEFHPSEEECRQHVRDSCESSAMPSAWAPPYQPLDLEFDDEAAMELVARFESAAQTCTLAPRVISVEGLWSQHLQQGDRCVDDLECPAEFWCIPDSVEPNASRHCGAGGQLEGAPCAGEGHCSEDFGCRIPEGATVGTCDKADLGEPCGTMPCRAGLLCKQEYTARSACVVPGELGTSCTLTRHSGCPDTLYCNGDHMNSACAERRNEGEFCGSNDWCRSRVCRNNLGIDSHCVACTSETCSGTCVDGACVPEPISSTVPQTVTARWPRYPIEFRPDGASCAYSDECASRYCQSRPECSGEFLCPSVCTPPPAGLAEGIWCRVAVYSRDPTW